MSVTDELLANNERYAANFDKGDLPLPPARGVAVIACMDARLNVERILGLGTGDAHIIRNAGGLATDDAIRSLVTHHTDCAMLTFSDDEVKYQIEAEVGSAPVRPSRTTWGKGDFAR